MELSSETSDKIITQDDYQMQDVHMRIMLLRVSTVPKPPLTVHSSSVC